MNLTIKVVSAQLLISDGTDRLYLNIEAPTPFPEMGYKPQLTMDFRHGYGLQYCKEVFGITPEVIDIYNKG